MPEEHPPVNKAVQLSVIQGYMCTFYRRYGRWVATNPTLVLCSSLGVVLLLCLGLVRFKVETRPEKLWVGPGSRAAEEKQFFDTHLAPFYRIEQVLHLMFVFTNTQTSQTTRVKGASKTNKRKGTASFVGECSQVAPSVAPSSQIAPYVAPSSQIAPYVAPSSAPPSTGPSNVQNFFGIGSVSQNIQQGKGKSKKQ